MTDPAAPSRWMTPRRGTAVSVLLTVGLLAAATVLVVRDDDPAPTRGAAVTDTTAVVADDPLSITLDGPIGRGGAEGQPVELTSTVIARDELDTVELWDGAHLVETRELGASGPQVTTTWTWTPTSPGWRPILVRGVDRRGGIGQSAPLWVQVQAAPAPPAGGRGSSRATNGVRPRTSTRDQNTPVVELDATTCMLTVPTDESASAVHLAMQGARAFAAITPARADDGIVVPAGTHLVQVIDAAGTAGPPAEVVAPPRCTERLWTGAVRISGGHLTTTRSADRAYVYISVDGRPWQRVPAADQSSVERGADGAFDLSGMLPPLSGTSVEVHAWGRSAGRLVDLGTGRVGLPKTMSAGGFGAGWLTAATGGPGSDLDWIVRKASTGGSPEIPAGPPTDALAREGTLSFQKGKLMTTGLFAEGGRSTLDFRWTTGAGAATHGVWQVSSLPPPASPALSYPGLLAFQVVGAPGDEFPIDLDAVVKGKGPTQSAPTPTVSFDDIAPPELVPVAAPGAISTATSGAKKKAPTKKSFPVHLLPALSQLVQPSVLYVRMVPMAGTLPLPAVSNWVVFGIGDTPPPLLLPVQPGGTESPKIASTTVAFTPPHQPNGSFQRCVRVMENPNAPSNQVTVAGVTLTGKPAPVGATLCADSVEPDKEWWEYLVDAFEFVADTWTEIATFVNELKADIITFIADLGCSQALDATGAVDDPTAACSKLITTAVDTYLAANGIPPTLPTADAVKEGLKGDLAAIAAEQASSYCPALAQSTCKAEAEKIADEILDRIEEEVSDATKEKATSGNWQLLLADDIRVVPEPAGQFGPAVFHVTVNLASPPLTDTFCAVDPQVTGTHPAWTYITTSQKPVTQPIGGSVFLPQAGTIRIPAGALTATGTVVLNHLNTSFAPTGASIYNVTAYKKTAPYLAWFDQAATLTMRLTGCGLDSSNAATSVIPGGIPYPKTPVEVQIP